MSAASNRPSDRILRMPASTRGDIIATFSRPETVPAVNALIDQRDYDSTRRRSRYVAALKPCYFFC